MRRVVPAILLCLMLAFAGCASVATGTGSAAANNFDMVGATYHLTMNDALRAALDACANRGIKITSQQETKSGNVIKGTQNGMPATITLTRMEIDLTQITVRIGLSGDRTEALRYLKAFGQNV